MTNMQRTIL